MRKVHQFQLRKYAQKPAFTQSCMDSMLSCPTFLGRLVILVNACFTSQDRPTLRKIVLDTQKVQKGFKNPESDSENDAVLVLCTPMVWYIHITLTQTWSLLSNSGRLRSVKSSRIRTQCCFEKDKAPGYITQAIRSHFDELFQN